MMKKSLLFILSLFIASFAYSQSPEDVQRKAAEQKESQSEDIDLFLDDLDGLFDLFDLFFPYWLLIDVTEYTRTDFPDPIFREYVFRNFDTNKNGIISKEEADAVKMIDVQKSGIKSLDGIQYFTNLTYLRCDYNQLTTLDVSKNSALTYLFCDYNQLTSLDLSTNTQLTLLICGSNQIEELDLSKTNLVNSSYNKKSSSLHPLECTPMPTLKTVYLKNGWNIRGINKKRRRFYIPQQTKIVYVN